MIPVELVGVRVEIPANTPMMLLREQTGQHRLLPIYIRSVEAAAIHDAIDGTEPPRPLTHDLFIDVLDELGSTLEKVLITDCREHTFFAELHLVTGEMTSVVSSRPSDAIALALRCEAPIFVDDDLLNVAGHLPPADEAEQAEDIIDEFKDFIDHVSPEDFATD